MMNLNNDESFVKLRHDLSLLGKRVIPSYLYKYYTDLFTDWQYNSCRQTAMAVCYYLTLRYPERTVSLYEAKFIDPYLGNTVHAFVYMKPTEEDNYGLLVDVSRISYPVLVERMTELRDPGTILSNKMGYKITMEEMNEVNWKEMLEQSEYFTHTSYHNFCKEVVDLLIKTLSKLPI